MLSKLLPLIIYEIVEISIFFAISMMFPQYHWNVFLGLIGIDIIVTVTVFPNRIKSYIDYLKS